MFRSHHALFTGLALAASVAIAAPAAAAETKKFDRAQFEAAQAAGKPIVVAAKAWWCPVCSSQTRTIRDAVKDPAYKNLIVFQINYDKQKKELPAFAIKKQGTILAYKGTEQVGRLDFVTDKPAIRALLAQTVN